LSLDPNLRVYLGSDHRGTALRLHLAQICRERGVAVSDLGPAPETGRHEYPEQALRVGESVIGNPGSLGILVCGTGIGVSIAANKVRGVRAALVSEPHGAAFARRHNDANVLCFGAGSVGRDLAGSCLLAFLDAEFEGGRHAERVASIAAIEGGEAGLGAQPSGSR